MMDKKQLKKYKSNKRRIAGIKKTIDKLVEQLDNVPVVPGKVTKSGDEFPYIEQHVKVVMETIILIAILRICPAKCHLPGTAGQTWNSVSTVHILCGRKKNLRAFTQTAQKKGKLITS